MKPLLQFLEMLMAHDHQISDPVARDEDRFIALMTQPGDVIEMIAKFR